MRQKPPGIGRQEIERGGAVDELVDGDVVVAVGGVHLQVTERIADQGFGDGVAVSAIDAVGVGRNGTDHGGDHLDLDAVVVDVVHEQTQRCKFAVDGHVEVRGDGLECFRLFVVDTGDGTVGHD